MYSNKTSFIYGFHGIDKEIAFKILNQDVNFKLSKNDYDWLGKGIYFWENNYERAVQYAEEDSKRKNSKIKTPFVLGAVIRWAHEIARENGESFDTVRAAFLEGDKLYPNAGFRMQNHIQISVLNSASTQWD